MIYFVKRYFSEIFRVQSVCLCNGEIEDDFLHIINRLTADDQYHQMLRKFQLEQFMKKLTKQLERYKVNQK